jgi:hypothetical protein
MTKLEELKAAAEEARDAVWSQNGKAITWAAWGSLWDARHAAETAYDDELKKTQEEKPMTKLEELKAAYLAADAAAWAVYDAVAYDAYAAAHAAWAAYEAELDKTQEENPND